MQNDSLHIDYEKIASFLSGELSPEENQAVSLWIEASEENRKVFEQCQELYWQDFSLDDNDEDSSLQKRFDVDNAWMNVSQTLNLPGHSENVIPLPHTGDEEKTVVRRMPWIGIAASLFLAAIVVFSYVYLQKNKTTTFANTSGTKTIFLPDSSKVVLEGISSLSYGPGFNSDHRNMQLSGKAYFDVPHRNQLHFEVETTSGIITVLGTAFLIDEQAGQLLVEVERGKVQLTSKNNSEQLLLEKNEKGILDRANFQLRKEQLNSMNHLYWANGKLVYRQATLSEVFDELGNLFQKDFIYDENTVENCHVSGVFKDQSFEAIIDNLSQSLNFEYKIAGNRVEITSNGCDSN